MLPAVTSIGECLNYQSDRRNKSLGFFNIAAAVLAWPSDNRKKFTE
jgi:hypothetical protein